MVEGARLESVYTGNRIKGSNPLVSAFAHRSFSVGGLSFVLEFLAVERERFFVYILQSMKDFSFYVGQCDDLDRRMSKHFDGMSKYTSSKRPLRLVYFETYDSRTEAIKRELEIKKKKSRKYIENLIRNWLTCPGG